MNAKLLGLAKQYWPLCCQAVADTPIPALILLAIMWRESAFGAALTPAGPTGTGDQGHGRGLMQIDDRSHADLLASNDWKDAEVNIRLGTQILADCFAYFRAKRYVEGVLQSAAIAAYNAGCGRVHAAVCAGHCPDEMTTGRDYSRWVLVHAKELGQLLEVSC